jgi:hypothetical protein
VDEALFQISQCHLFKLNRISASHAEPKIFFSHADSALAGSVGSHRTPGDVPSSIQGESMSPRSIRRAQEHKARKLARKAEKSALQPNPELYDEFSPELIAEANAALERVSRRAGLGSPDALSYRTKLQTEPEASATHPISPAQLAANRANSQHSTGAKTSEGKQIVSFNAFRHGLAGRFVILPHENECEFKELFHGLQHEHRPSTPTEHLLIESMAQHYWLAQRALNLQQFCFDESGVDEKLLALYLRYQTTHDRAFHKCLNDLLKLRAQKRREQIGFVSQEHKRADQTRREARENRQQERHKWAVLLAQAKVDHQRLQNTALEASEKLAAAA